jgi:RAT1-interacting protein
MANSRPYSARAPPWGATAGSSSDSADRKRSYPGSSSEPAKRAKNEPVAAEKDQELYTGTAQPSNSPHVQGPPSRFPVQPLKRFEGASASIKRPREIAHFSYDDNHEYREDESGINYYHPPQVGADLRDGFETFKHYEDKEDPHLDSLLKTLLSKERESKKLDTDVDFVTWRGMMTKVRS